MKSEGVVLWLHGPSIAEEATADRNELKELEIKPEGQDDEWRGTDSRQGVRESSRDQVIN